MALSSFHPAVADWFRRSFVAPTPVQVQSWREIRAGRHALIAAPTGSGKTLAAFLAAIDGLLREGLQAPLAARTRVLYVSPLKALSNDIHQNLERPLTGIRDALLERGLGDVEIRAAVRTGDTPAGERERMRRRPPHILVTTPESLYVLLGSDSGRRLLAGVETVICDELHAVAGNKRGAHLMLSLERLEALAGRPLRRIGLSATQRPVEAMARFLVGDREDPCAIVDTGHDRPRDLALELPGSPLEAILSNEVWEEIYDRLAELIEAHDTTLVFVNTRRLAERAAAALARRLGEEVVTSHHGSLSREHRLQAEERLRAGRLRALVATASLELGIDIGAVDLVCQLGSPRSIAAFLQRVGRSGHAVGATPKGRLFPLSRDDLAECAALLDAVGRGELDRIPIPARPLDVLAQQVVAEVAARDWAEAELYRVLRRAWPYRDLEPATWEQVLQMLADGFHTRRGRRGAYLHRDRVQGRLRARRGARMVALTNGGAIPDQFDYDVLLQPEGLYVGSLNEDFAFESLPGDIFQLGNASYRMLRIEQGRGLVEDARGLPPTIPFWFGEAPGRSDELSAAVSRLRETVDAAIARDGPEGARRALEEILGAGPAAAQLAEHLSVARAALGRLPSHRHVVLERFFDQTGDMHLVVHSPFGSRINRAWGLALRKRFCRKFNFELQAAATEDCIVLSLGASHSFPLAEVARYLSADGVRDVLVQALLAAPMFATRWRWVANTALAVPRNRGGRRVPAPFQRNDAEDLVALVFPDQLACLENIAGDREVPDHPLVTQTLRDCLHEVMDVAGLQAVLRGIETGEIGVGVRDLPTPSPLALEVLNARPYAFLDDAPAEERRTLAVEQRRFQSVEDAAAMGRLDPEAIARVREEAWPRAEDADELHDALCLLGWLDAEEAAAEPRWRRWLDELAANGRAARARLPGGVAWFATERLHELLALDPRLPLEPALEPVERARPAPEAALRELLRSRLEGLGPVSAARLGALLGLPPATVEGALLGLEAEGFAVRGRFEGTGEQWCDRALLARIHRYTLKRLRAGIRPVSLAAFMAFLCEWQGLRERVRGPRGLERVLEQLEGLPAPAAAWEEAILPARIEAYSGDELDRLCAEGRFLWLRRPPGAGRSVRNAPIAFVSRGRRALWLTAGEPGEREPPGGAAARVLASLRQWGASFHEELVEDTGLLPSQVDMALAELVAGGWVSSDRFAGLRALLQPAGRRPPRRGRGRLARGGGPRLGGGGRWSLVRPPREASGGGGVEELVRVLLRRYGVLFRSLLARETGLPPWRDLLYALRRLEARGELRGGRFVDGVGGEQFALPEALPALRRQRHEAGAEGRLQVLSAADPLNLSGILDPGPRVPPRAETRLVYRDGVLVAVQDRRGFELRGPAVGSTGPELARIRAALHGPTAVRARGGG